MTMGNVRERPLDEIVRDMTARFPSDGACFINKNYRMFQARSRGAIPLSRDASIDLLENAESGAPADFFKLYNS
jgi:hypothetical protein